MRTYQTKKGPFKIGVYYELEEIEKICNDELKAMKLYPSKPEPIRIDRFIEKRFKIVPEYKDLPDGVLGSIVFGGNGVEKISVARSLSEEGSKSSERRINTTLAHEAGHGLLHSPLIPERQNNQLFNEMLNFQKTKVLCRDIPGVTIENRNNYNGEWWEFQANHAIGALLLPKELIIKALNPFLMKRGKLGNKSLSKIGRNNSAKILARRFDVNPVVAQIRIDELYPLEKEKQISL